MRRSHLTRFAPAPTGLLHLGHVVNALFVWGLARRLGASVLLRIEDHDTQRSKPAFETRLLDDLDWIGFRPDHYPTSAFRAGRCRSRQRNRNSVYEDAAAVLRAQGLLYGCVCTRQDVATRRASGGRVTGCPGACDARGLAPESAPTWRVRMATRDESFVDLLRGPTTQLGQPADGDPVIRDRHGNWTYTFAVVVDDLEQGVDLIVRGDDLLASTRGQIQLAGILGRATPPVFAHHRLVMKSPTQKLSKADDDTGIGDLREQGWRPERVIGQAAAAVGLAPAGALLSVTDAIALVGAIQLAVT